MFPDVSTSYIKDIERIHKTKQQQKMKKIKWEEKLNTSPTKINRWSTGI